MNRTLSIASLALSYCCACCCPGGSTPPPVPPLATAPLAVAPTAAMPAAPAAATAEQPKLVVLVVIDQLGSRVLAKYLPHLPEDGAIRRGVARGSLYDKIAYEYANTSTAPGHAAIVTGAAPWMSGIVANTTYDAKTGKEVPFMGDGENEVIGRPGRTAGPSALRVPTVGDELDRATGGKAIVVSVAGKDRSATVLAGKRSDLALWYENSIPAFTSSTMYGPALPPWLSSWVAAHPISSIMVPWTPTDPALLARAAGPDEGKGEGGDYMKQGATFPYDPNKAPDPHAMLRLFPQLSEYTLDVARVCADEMAMGKDGVVDLLMVSISGTDYAGHSYGPDSWEYFDHLLRVDRALARFFAQLEKGRGPIAAIITSDHGVMPLPEQNPRGGGRVYTDELAKVAKQTAKAAVKDEGAVLAYVNPYLFLSPDIGEKRAALVAALKQELEKQPGVHLVVDVRDAAALRESDDRIARAVGLSIADNGPGDLYVLTRDGFVIDEGRPKGAGTAHGTPWDEDRLVPLVAWGPGVAHARHEAELSQTRVAPTLARLLGIAPPGHIVAEPRPGVASVPADISRDR